MSGLLLRQIPAPAEFDHCSDKGIVGIVSVVGTVLVG